MMDEEQKLEELKAEIKKLDDERSDVFRLRNDLDYKISKLQNKCAAVERKILEKKWPDTYKHVFRAYEYVTDEWSWVVTGNVQYSIELGEDCLFHVIAGDESNNRTFETHATAKDYVLNLLSDGGKKEVTFKHDHFPRMVYDYDE